MTISTVLASLFAVAGAQPVLPQHGGTAGSYRYESVSDPSFETSVITIDLDKKTLVYPATVTEMEACPSSRGRCFKTTRMSFCAPTDSELRAKEWECGDGDLKFKLKGERTLRILGDQIHTLVVSRHGTEYFYSPERGLVMFRFLYPPIYEVYWAVDGRGFGADDSATSK